MSVVDESGVDFKHVSIGPVSVKIPGDWDLISLEDVAENSGEYGANAPAQPFDADEFRYIRITDLTEDGKLKNCTKQSIPIEGNEKYELQNGDLLFARTGAVGRSYLYSESVSEVRCAFAGYLIRYKLTGNIDSEYLRQYTNSEYFNKWVSSVSRSTTHANINASEYSSVDIPYPPLTEQRRIAEILSTVDELIQQTDAVIEETKRLKRGLMQDLLTRGIGHESYKRVQIGVETRKIPENWMTIRMGDDDYADIVMGGTPDTDVDDYWGGNIPWMRSGDLHQRFITKVEGSLTEKGKKAARLDYIPKHSILVGLNGQGKTKGTVAINEIRLIANQSVGAYIINREKLDPRYLYYYLDSKYQYLRALAGGGRSGLNLTLLGQVKIAYPPLPEQRRIADILSTVDAAVSDSIQKQNQTVTKLEALKRGLMQDLLTGKVRVPVET